MVDFSIPTRENPVSHPAADAPLCRDCQKMNLQFFDPTCGSCQDILLNPKTSIPQLFAVMRQWVPQTQRNMKMLTREVLRRGAHVNDKDSLTDLTLIHYACKSGAAGVGNTTASADLVSDLITKGADTSMKCRWTDMNVLHYATFFDCPSLVETLLEADKDLLNATSKHFDGGTSLHIAAANLNVQAAKTLLSLGADPLAEDAKGKTPRECIRIPSDVSEDMTAVVAELSQLLEEAEQVSLEQQQRQQEMQPQAVSEVVAMENEAARPAVRMSSCILRCGAGERVRSPTATSVASSGDRDGETPTLASLGVAIGDRVMIGADTSRQPKVGTLRFFGATEFASGTFAGVELDDPVGKNDGSLGGIRYFTCTPKHGIFAPVHKITKATGLAGQSGTLPKRSSFRLSDVAGRKKDSPTSTLERNKASMSDIEVGDRVTVGGSLVGTVRFAGVTKFAPGLYLGVELDQPQGKNDGSVDGTRYFTCKPNYGLFTPPSKVKRLFRRLDSISRDTSSPDQPAAHSNIFPVTRTGSLKRDRKPYTSSTPNRSSVVKSKQHEPVVSSSSPSNTLPPIKEGISVYYNGEVGVIRYIGAFDLSDGTWIGLEMKRPCGKNDGSVQGKRYFTCKPNHGVMVRPSKVTYRGINCSKLLPPPET
ncbi:CAP-Gly domain-containing linker protein 3-like isoform X2 [Dysidea avara]